MSATERVVFRCYENQEPMWEAYGIDHAVYGSGDSLSEARDDIKAAISLLLEVEEDSIELDEFHERLARGADDKYPDVWVRALQDRKSERMLERRKIQESIKKLLEKNPEYVGTFRNGIASTGDIIAVVSFEDDMLYDVMGQIGSTDLIYLCMPEGDTLYWQTLFTSEASVPLEAARRISDLELGDCVTVGQFMRVTHAKVNEAEKFLAIA